MLREQFIHIIHVLLGGLDDVVDVVGYKLLTWLHWPLGIFLVMPELGQELFDLLILLAYSLLHQDLLLLNLIQLLK